MIKNMHFALETNASFKLKYKLKQFKIYIIVEYNIFFNMLNIEF